MDWGFIYDSLRTKGYALVPGVLSREECEHAMGFYNDSNLFRTTVNMQRYRFGKGEYKYFQYPLPPIIQVLREEFYQPLAKIANEWMAQLSQDISFPENHREMLDVCNSKKQVRPTPLILRYEAGGYNTLHQDLYGEVYFPF